MRLVTDRFLRHLELVRDKVPDWTVYPLHDPRGGGARHARIPPERHLLRR